MQICGNKSNQKSIPGFPPLRPCWPIDSAGRGGAGGGCSNVIDSPGEAWSRRGRIAIGDPEQSRAKKGQPEPISRGGGHGRSDCRERRPPRPLEPRPGARQQRTRRRSPGSVRRAGSLGARPRECRRRSLRRPPSRRAPLVSSPLFLRRPPAASILVTAGRPRRGGGMARAAPSGGGPQ